MRMSLDDLDQIYNEIEAPFEDEQEIDEIPVIDRYSNATQSITPETNIKYVPYYRVSTKKQGASGLGLEAQKAFVEHYSSHGTIVAEFTEVVSGKSINKRVELERAIRFCNENGYTLIVAKADRLARNTREALEVYESLNGRFVSCDCPTTDKFTLTLLFAFAEREREMISIRTKLALTAKKQRVIDAFCSQELWYEMAPEERKNVENLIRINNSVVSEFQSADVINKVRDDLYYKYNISHEVVNNLSITNLWNLIVVMTKGYMEEYIPNEIENIKTRKEDVKKPVEDFRQTEEQIEENRKIMQSLKDTGMGTYEIIKTMNNMGRVTHFGKKINYYYVTTVLGKGKKRKAQRENNQLKMEL